MKIAISATVGNLDAMIDPRFGRCPYFVILDSDTLQFEVISNAALNAGGGAGIQAAQVVASKGVKMLITGNVGPHAFQALSATGIKVVTGAFGTVREVVEKYKRGELKETGAPTVRGHFGTGGGQGSGWRRVR